MFQIHLFLKNYALPLELIISLRSPGYNYWIINQEILGVLIATQVALLLDYQWIELGNICMCTNKCIYTSVFISVSVYMYV